VSLWKGKVWIWRCIIKVKETVFEDRIMTFEEMMAYHIQFSRVDFEDDYCAKAREYLNERGFSRLTGDIFKEEISYYEARFTKEIVRDATCEEHQAYYYLKMFGEVSCQYYSSDCCSDSCFMVRIFDKCVALNGPRFEAIKILKNITVVEE